jgi:hypothetical protein
MADYYTIRPADFIVMDALQGLEFGPTPSFDQSGIRNIEDAQKNMRSVLASRDSLAIDIVQTNIINWDFESVLYLQLLREAGKVGNGETRNITVLGNAKVDDLRSDFGGRVPQTGGRRLTEADLAAPSAAIISASFDGDNLRLNLSVSGDTDKLDIYIDGRYAGSASGSMGDVTINTAHLGLAAGDRDIRVYAYTKFMSHASASATARK